MADDITTIQISRENRLRLTLLEAGLKIERRENVSANDVITFLLDEHDQGVLSPTIADRAARLETA